MLRISRTDYDKSCPNGTERLRTGSPQLRLRPPIHLSYRLFLLRKQFATETEHKKKSETGNKTGVGSSNNGQKNEKSSA